MIEINDTSIKTPQRCTVGIEDVGSKSRNALGETLLDRIAVKRKIEMEWGPLSNAECAAVLTAISPTFFRVDYPDPEEGIEKTIVCFAEKKSAPMLKYSGSTPYWEGLKVTLSER